MFQATHMYHYGSALPALRDTFKTCGWQTLLCNPRQGIHPRGCHIRRSVLLSEGSFCLEGLGSDLVVLWSDISTNPLSVMTIQAPSPLLDNWNLSWEAERTAGVSCYHADSHCCPLKTRGSQLRGTRERKKRKRRVFRRTLALYYATILCLTVSWHGNEQTS